MLSRKILKITFISFLGLVLIILLFLGLRINSYKIFITSLVDGEKQIGLNKNMTGFESPGDGNLESLQRAYGDKLIVLESVDQFSEDERKIISEITKKDYKPRYDRDTWVTRSY